ncbi:MAG: hypothetical protein GY838_13640 [bacterium]|nr:hypothetical protein [bacterium]
MAGLVLRSTFKDLYEERLPYLEELIYNAYDEHVDEYSQVLNMNTSSRMSETDFSVAEFGLFPTKAEGTDLTLDSIEPGYTKTHTHVTYARGTEVTKESLQDDQDGIMADQAYGLGFAGRQTVETVAFDEVFNNGFTTSTSADGLSIYNSSHELVKGGTWSNTASADLDVPSLEAALTHFAGLVDEAGKKIRMMASKLVVPTALLYQAIRLVESEGRPDTADRAKNAFRNFSISIFEGHYLSSSTAWFLCADARQLKAKFYWRQRPQVESEVDFWSKSGMTSMDLRFSVGVSDPRGLYGSTG